MLSNKLINYGGLLLLILSTPGWATDKQHEDNRAGYSFFGAGLDFLDYEENTAPGNEK